MRVIEVKPKSTYVGEKCRHCSHIVKAGHVVAWCRTNSFIDPRFIIHMQCMERMVKSAPAPIDVKQSQKRYDEIRRRIIEEGSAWV